MSPHRDPFNVRWGDVREKVKAELADIKDALVTAQPERITALQGRAQALQFTIHWFEHGALAEAALTEQ